ncbi:hypothetical protein [Halobaculum sp. MBLA0143]|uniref:hypothetical protein n=1 Tax=Halobaculum sp. MBLA0143 TaxID=3079933 RepID=UPI003524B32F
MTDEMKFEDLLVDEEEVNEELLTETVIDYVQIGEQSGELIPKPAYDDLTAKEKIVVALLAHRARFGLDMVEDEWIKPGAIASMTGVKKGTVYPTVRDLADDGIARNSDDGGYMIPSVNVEQAREYLRGDA